MIVKNNILYLLIIFFFVRCDNNNKIIEYYDNGNIMSENYMGNDNVIDSSYIYYPTNELKQIIYFDKLDTINNTKLYYKFGDLKSEGKIVKKRLDFRIGIWKKYGKNLDSIIEYINLNNKPYLNQVWVLNNKTKDTLKNEGNFYEIKFNDNITIGDTVQFRFFQYLPFFGYDSDIEVILPLKDAELNKDFSNFNEIERDTFHSLKNDGIPHPEIPSDIPINHYVQFGMIFEKSGNHKIRGYIAEYINDNIDTLKRIERRLYFDESIFIKDSLN